MRLDFLAAVERLAADEQMRDAARLDRVDVAPRHVVAEADEAAEQHARCAAAGSTRCSVPSTAARDLQPLSFDQPGDERADRVRQRFLDRLAPTTSAGSRRGRTVVGTGSATIAGWRRVRRAATRRARRTSACSAAAVAGHLRRERGVDEPLNLRARCGSSCVNCRTRPPRACNLRRAPRQYVPTSVPRKR